MFSINLRYSCCFHQPARPAAAEPPPLVVPAVSNTPHQGFVQGVGGSCSTLHRRIDSRLMTDTASRRTEAIQLGPADDEGAENRHSNRSSSACSGELESCNVIIPIM
jgi:hypothetical protein